MDFFVGETLSDAIHHRRRTSSRTKVLHRGHDLRRVAGVQTRHRRCNRLACGMTTRARSCPGRRLGGISGTAMRARTAAVIRRIMWRTISRDSQLYHVAGDAKSGCLNGAGRSGNDEAPVLRHRGLSFHLILLRGWRGRGLVALYPQLDPHVRSLRPPHCSFRVQLYGMTGCIAFSLMAGRDFALFR